MDTTKLAKIIVEQNNYINKGDQTADLFVEIVDFTQSNFKGLNLVDSIKEVRGANVKRSDNFQYFFNSDSVCITNMFF